MDKIYGIFNGCYSDWEVKGYFTDRTLAEKYCAKKNVGDDRWDKYYIVEINSIQDGVKGLENVKLKYKHEVVFDYNRENHNMRYEPDRYSYYMETKSENNAIKSYLNGWIAFYIQDDSPNRDKVEKVANDMFNQFKYLVDELGEEKSAIEELSKITGYDLILN